MFLDMDGDDDDDGDDDNDARRSFARWSFMHHWWWNAPLPNQLADSRYSFVCVCCVGRVFGSFVIHHLSSPLPPPDGFVTVTLSVRCLSVFRLFLRLPLPHVVIVADHRRVF